jgi:predicted aspartyl protease
MDTPIIRQVCINKTNHCKTFHLVVQINRTLIESLVDNGASMLIMAPSVVRELGIMHVVSSHEMYKTTSRTITQALGKIIDVLVTISNVVCQIDFPSSKH